MSPIQNLHPRHDHTAPVHHPTLRSPRPRPPHAHGGGAVAGIGLVALWLVSGFLFELGSFVVVLLGVLLLAAFQTLVRRRPLRTLLVRDTASFARAGRESCWSPRSWSRSRQPWCCCR